MVEVKNRNANIETIEEWKPKKSKGREKIISRQSKAKSFRGWLQASITLLRNDKKIEQEYFFKVVLDKLDEYSGRDKVILKMWKGKSGLKIIEKPDSFYVVRHQKIEKDGKLETKVAEIQKTEVNEMIHAINRLNTKLQEIGTNEEINQGIPTSKIAELTYGENWKTQVYANRKLHHTITYILNILEQYGMIKYSRAGFTKIIKRADTIQEVLKWHTK